MDEKKSFGDLEMLKALYDFNATFSKTLSFNEGEYFLLNQNNTKERNWWPVVNRRGQSGFVPSNYVSPVKVEADFLMSFINDSLSSLNDDKTTSITKQELINRLKHKKKQIQTSLNSTSTKKPPAPKPPTRFDGVSSPNGVSPSLDLRPIVSEQNLKEIKNDNLPETNVMKEQSSKPTNEDSNSDSSDNIKPNAVYEIVQAVRKETQLSHDMSKVAVETVLVSLREFLPGGAARSIIDALLREANSNVTCPTNAMSAAPDAIRMVSALNALSKAANDAQQRGWALHDDAHDIQTQLLELISVMTNADVSISRHVLSTRRYSYVTMLVQYYQMETRWPLRQHLLQAFGIMCGLERTAQHTLAVSLLPAEVARDMRDNPTAVTRLSHSALLLSMVLSMGDKLPITHFEQLGMEFAQFLLELIESPPDNDVDEQIPDLFLTLLLAYNLQFNVVEENLLLDALETRQYAKTFTEKLLFLLNREDDPVRIFDHEPAPPHSVLKLVIDLFSRRTTADLFYTNDVNVMIDITVRQLADLSPGDPRRQNYLKLVQGVFRNTDYDGHRHRLDDLVRCFARLFCEEHEDKSNQALVKAISNEFPHYFKPKHSSD